MHSSKRTASLTSRRPGVRIVASTHGISYCPLENARSVLSASDASQQGVITTISLSSGGWASMLNNHSENICILSANSEVLRTHVQQKTFFQRFNARVWRVRVVGPIATVGKKIFYSLSSVGLAVYQPAVGYGLAILC